VYALLISPMRATFSTQLILLDLILIAEITPGE
jgi:hypothetical protein